MILEALRELTPDIPIVAEEEVARPARSPRSARRPLLARRPARRHEEFISRNGEFTVNVALIEGDQPLLGVVTAPAQGSPGGVPAGHGAVPARGRRGDADPRPPRPRPRRAVAVASRSHRDAETDAWLAERGIAGHGLGRQLAQVLPRRRGQGRRLPALRHHDGVGHRRRPRRAARRGRPGRDLRRRPVRLRQAQLQKPRLHRRGGLTAAALRELADRLGRRALFLLPPERAHRLAIRALPILPAAPLPAYPRLRCRLAGLDLPHPLGLAAGFDKNAEAFAALLRQAFAFVEVGTVTPKPQAGNPRPRLFRLPEDRALVNRLGFNNEGLEAVAGRLAGRDPRGGVVGVNIGMNRDAAVRRPTTCRASNELYPLADYVTVNVSSPNTPGLRALQAAESLARCSRRCSLPARALVDPASPASRSSSR